MTNSSFAPVEVSSKRCCLRSSINQRRNLLIRINRGIAILRTLTNNHVKRSSSNNKSVMIGRLTAMTMKRRRMTEALPYLKIKTVRTPTPRSK